MMSLDEIILRGRGRGRVTPVMEAARAQRDRAVEVRNRMDGFVFRQLRPTGRGDIFDRVQEQDLELQQEGPEVRVDMVAAREMFSDDEEEEKGPPAVDDQAPVVSVKDEKMEKEEGEGDHPLVVLTEEVKMEKEEGEGNPPAVLTEEVKIEKEEEKEGPPIVEGECVSPKRLDNFVEVAGKRVAGAAVMNRFGDVRPVRVVRSFGPGEFYVIEEKDASSAIQKENEVLYRQFQAEMNKSEWVNIMGKMRVLRASSQECFAYQNKLDKQWYRVRLLKIASIDPETDKEISFGLVYFLDLDIFQYVPLTELRQLPDKFSTGLTRIFRCHLKDAVPTIPDSEDKIGPVFWSEEAVEYFNKLIMSRNEGETVSILPLDWAVTEPGKMTTDARYNLGVFLFVSSEVGAMTSVGWKMIEKGYATKA